MPKGTFYYLLATDTLPCTGPKPFRRSLLGKTEERLFPFQLLGWKATRNVSPASVYAHNTLSSVTLQALLGVALLCTVWVYISWGEQRIGWSHCPISLFFLWDCCLLWLLQLSKILCPVTSYGSYKGTLVFCCLSVSLLSHTDLLIIFVWSPPLSSFSITVDIFCSFCSLFPMIWGQQGFAYAVEQKFSSLSHHVQVFVGLSLSIQALRQGSLVHCIFHHVNEETEPLLCLSLPRLCRAIPTWADAFPTRRRRGRKTGVFLLCVICEHLRLCSQAGLGWVLGLKLCHPHFSEMQSPGSHLTTHSSSANSEGSPNRQSHHHPINICLMSYSPGNWTHVFILLVEYTCKLNIVW